MLARLGCEVSEAGVVALAAAGLTVRAVSELDAAAAAAAALGLSAEDARLVGALAPQRGANEAALKFDHCGAGVQGRGTDTCSGKVHGWHQALGAEPLDLSDGPVFWKATIVQLKENMFIGVTGNAQPAANSFNDPTSLSWCSAGNSHVYIRGVDFPSHGGWAAGNIVAGDVCVFKLEAQQLSVRVQRLGAQTFTIATDGAPNLRVFVAIFSGPSRVQLSRAEPGEEYSRGLVAKAKVLTDHCFLILNFTRPTSSAWSCGLTAF